MTDNKVLSPLTKPGVITAMVVRKSDLQRFIPDSSELFRISVADYHEMIRAEILTPEDRCELLDGCLVKKMSQNPPHSNLVEYLTELLIKMIASGVRVRVQLPITLEESEPEPDLAIVRGDAKTFRDRHPNAKETFVVIEVSDTTLFLDRNGKKQIYAREGIPEYWVVNIPEKCVEVYRLPEQGDYQSKSVYGVGDELKLELDGRTLGVIAVSPLMT